MTQPDQDGSIIKEETFVIIYRRTVNLMLQTEKLLSYPLQTQEPSGNGTNCYCIFCCIVIVKSGGIA